ncbi:MAG TPA: PrsW family glutamic-type intramembrane protease, partial [Candidatus Gracilibacteria bacterium]|nr:PrsW family glutamic-type intramembrane protease [Candidatus Gracilibacteria bacterium]
MFFLSIFSVVPVFALQYFLNLFPQFDILAFLQNQIHNQNANYILLFISVGIVEEIVKQIILRFVDRKYLLIQTINDSIHYSLISALGFAFAENIFYIFAIYNQLGWQQLIIPYLFRSIFTTAAHLIFSGFFGYFYGLAKFSMNITEQSRWAGKKHRFANFIGTVFKMSRLQAVKELTIIRGLIVAIALHAVFNFLLQLNQIIPVA